MCKGFFFLCFLMSCGVAAMAQDFAPIKVDPNHHVCYGTVLDGDTIPLFYLREVYVTESGSLLTQQEIKKNQKLIRNVKKMLPYAKEGKRRLDILERQAASLPAKQRKELIKQAEKDLLADYEEELKACTFSQGKVLIKMIDRETGRTSYVLVNELRGKLRASFYQVFARIFGFNLKTHYDPQHNKDDNLMERVIISVETGRL